MKKIVLVFGLVLALSLVSVASATTLQEQIAALQTQLAALMAQAGGTTASVSSIPEITKSLTIGSKGDEVSALQKYLEEEGLLTMPAGVDYGYFGGLTKAAVVEWQKANDVSPASGYFGPISRAALDALREAAPVVTTPTPGTTPVVGLDNTDGSVSAVLGALAPSTATLKKGDTDKPVYGVRFTATGGKVSVNRMDVHFADRPWLMFTEVKIKDASGAVLATKTLSGSADVTTATENSDYYVRFEGLNIVVTPGSDTNIVVVVSVPSSSSFIGTAPYDSTRIAIPAGAIRTVNGKGIYDSLGIDGVMPSGNTVSLTTAGSAADLTVTLDGTSPSNGTQVYVATAGGADTTGVPLAVYNFRSGNQDSTLYSLAFTVATDPALGSNLGTSMKIFKLSDGTSSYYGSLSGSTVTFTINPGLVLTKDTNKKLTLSADISASSTAFAASTTLDVSAISATDANYVTPTYGGATMSGVTSDVTGSNLTFTNSSMALSGTSVTSPANATKLVDANGNPYQYSDVAYTFTLTNNSSGDLWVSTNLGVFLGTSTVVTNASSTINRWGTIQSITGDVTGAYRIMPGSSNARTFVAYGDIKKRSNVTSSEQLKITSINYGTSSAAPTGGTITTGLENLSFSGTVVTSF
ncbi:MAG: peptidoglycan-binding protein [Candidatus Paceibacterota bacterium]